MIACPWRSAEGGKGEEGTPSETRFQLWLHFRMLTSKPKSRPFFWWRHWVDGIYWGETDWTSSSEAPTRTAVHTLKLFKVKENFINTKGNNRRDLLLQVAVSHTHNHKDTHIHIYKQRVQHKIVNLQTTTTTCKDILVLIWNFITLVSNAQQKVVPMKQNPSIRQPVCGLISFTTWWRTFEMRQFHCQLISVSLSTRD